MLISGNLLNGIMQSKDLLLAKLQEQSREKQEELTNRIENVFKMATSKHYVIFLCISKVNSVNFKYFIKVSKFC